MNKTTNNSSEARKLWTDALRSGEYKQTQGTLHCNTDKGYCCLGVACEVYQKYGPGDLEVEEDTFRGRMYDKHDTHLPVKVAQWLDINTGGKFQKPMQIDNPPESFVPYLDEGEKLEAQSLIGLNDDYNYNFAAIANVIEQGNIEPCEVK